MFLTFLVLFSAFLLEAIGTYVSVVGLATLFAYSMVVMIMAVALDVAKVANVTFLYRHWKDIGWAMKSYMLAATLVLMMITSTGVFGYLSGEFQKAIAGNSQQTVVIQSLTEEQGRLQKRKEEIDKQVAQLPQTNVRGRRQLMDQFGPEVKRLNNRLEEIDKKLPELKVANIDNSTHVGPILYVAQAFDTTPEKAVKWVILTIIFVFDPLAITLLIAGNFLLMRRKIVEEPAITEATDSLPPPNWVKEDKRVFNATPPGIHGNENFSLENVARDVHAAYIKTALGSGNDFELDKTIEKNLPDIMAEPVPPVSWSEPVREQVVIKPVEKKPRVKVEGDKVKLDKPLMPTSLDNVRDNADFNQAQELHSKMKTTYEKD